MLILKIDPPDVLDVPSTPPDFSSVRFTELPALNFIQQFLRIVCAIRSGAYVAAGRGPARVGQVGWYGVFEEEFAGHLLRQAIYGFESYVRGAAKWQATTAAGKAAVQKVLDDVPPKALKGGGMANYFFNFLPALHDPTRSMKIAEPPLWQATRALYRDVRNKLLHGYELQRCQPEDLHPVVDHYMRLLAWVNRGFPKMAMVVAFE